MEIKTYAFTISTDDVFDALQDKTLDQLVQMMKSTKGFVGIHPSPDGIMTYFLFLTPKARNECSRKAMEMGFDVGIVLNPAFVNADYLK